MSLMEPDTEVLSVEYKINFLSPADGDLLIAKAKVVKSGKTLSVTSADVFIRKNNKMKLCAVVLMTMIKIRN